MKINFRDILQCAAGPFKGLLAQVTAVTDVDVELLSRDKDGTPNTFRVTEVEIHSWRHTGGMAISGPKPHQLSEPAAAPDRGGEPGQDVATEVITGASDAAAVRSLKSPLASLNVEELMKPLPPDAKVVPMDHEEPAPLASPTPTWNMDDPEPTPEQQRQDKRYVNQQRIESNPLPKIKYSALVANGNGQQTRVEYSLRKGIPPERFAGIPIKMSKKFIEDVAPMKVLNYTPLA